MSIDGLLVGLVLAYFAVMIVGVRIRTRGDRAAEPGRRAALRIVPGAEPRDGAAPIERADPERARTAGGRTR